MLGFKLKHPSINDFVDRNGLTNLGYQDHSSQGTTRGKVRQLFFKS